MILTCFESEGATFSPWPLGLAFKFRWGWVGLTLRVGVTKFFMLNAPEAMSFLNLSGFQTFQSKNVKCLRWFTCVLKLKFHIFIQKIKPCYFANISGSTYFAPSGRVPGLRRCWILAFFRCFFSSRIRFAEICSTKNNTSSCLITFLKTHIF